MTSNLEIHPLVPEASTRRFWRIKDRVSRIAMHSPPETENNPQFVYLANLFRERGIPVPDIFAYEPQSGYLLVTDFGTTELKDILGNDSLKNEAIHKALQALIEIQHVPQVEIPLYSVDRLSDELDIFKEWCCDRLIGCDASPLDSVADGLVKDIDNQPKVTVHRDFHCRNLLYQNGRLGIVDFQDALFGPCTYDLASLVYDCYYQHGAEDIDSWIDVYLSLAARTKLKIIRNREAFVFALEQVALQRQIKAVGIFCRLWLKQSKKSHLPFVASVLDSTARLSEKLGLSDLSSWLLQEVKPRVESELVAVL